MASQSISNAWEGKLDQFNYGNIKSKYILKQIFDNLHKKKCLEIIKYNKKIQQKISVNTNDYKECSEVYSSIEIEIIPIANKLTQFININKDDEKYYHIYFNDNNEEIKRNYLNTDDLITKIYIKIDYQVESFKELFFNCKYIKSINFKKFCRNNINNMHCMFWGCSKLNKINFLNCNTNNVTDMSGLFSWCSSLEEINLSNFNTNNVTDMSFMFNKCSSLKKINLSNFYMKNVFNKRYMFQYCSSLMEINFPEFNINNINDLNHMFNGCSDDLKNKIKTQLGI